jgi:hypothetical protein
MRRATGLSSGEFLKGYTIPLLADDAASAVVGRCLFGQPPTPDIEQLAEAFTQQSFIAGNQNTFIPPHVISHFITRPSRGHYYSSTSD